MKAQSLFSLAAGVLFMTLGLSLNAQVCTESYPTGCTEIISQLSDWEITPSYSGTGCDYTLSFPYAVNTSLPVTGDTRSVTGLTWYVDGVQVGSGTNNLAYSFNVVGDCHKVESFTLELCVSIEQFGTYSGSYDCHIAQEVDVQSCYPINPDFDISAVQGACGDVTFSWVALTGGSITSPSWDFGDGNTATGSPVTHNFASNGLFSVVLTDAADPNFCQVVDHVVINSRPKPAFTWTNSCTSNDVEFTISGFDPANLYEVDFGDFNSAFVTSATFVHTYTSQGNFPVEITITDATGCTGSTAKNVSTGPMNADFGTTTPVCVSDHLSVYGVMNGAASYSWTVDGNAAGNGTAPNFLFNSAGSYDVQLTVVSPSGCTDVSAIRTVDVLDGPTVDVSPADACGSGDIELTVSGTFTTSDTYTVNYGDGTVEGPFSVPSEPFTLNHTYAEGYYAAVVTVNPGSCPGTGNATVVVGPENDLLISAPSALCDGESGFVTTVLTNPGTGVNYTYTWSPTGSGSAFETFGDASGNTINYAVTVTNDGGCPAITASTDIKQLASPLGVASDAVATTCPSNADGSATLYVNVALAADGYTVNGGPVIYTTPHPLTGLSAGTNYFTIANALDPSCTANISVDIPAGGPTLAMSATDATSCITNNGSAAVVATGGAPPYTYAWTNVQTGAALPTTATITGLAPGTYLAEVTDANACAVTSTVSVGQIGLQLALANQPLIACANGQILAEMVPTYVNGSGTPSATYTWSPSGNGASSLVAPGNYTVDATDATTGCETSLSFTVQEVADLSVTIGIDPPTCVGEKGTAVAYASGGTGNYSYDWSWSAGAPQPVYNILALIESGSVTVDVTDDAGCSMASATETVAPLSTPPTDIAVTIPSSGCDMQVDITDPDNDGPYSVEWTQVSYPQISILPPTGLFPLSSQTSPVPVNKVVYQHGGPANQTIPLTPFEDGADYVVTVEDANGCQYSETITLNFSLTLEPLAFDFVFSRVDLETPDEPVAYDPVLRENMAEAVNDLFNATQSCVNLQIAEVSGTLEDHCLNPDDFEDAFAIQYQEEQHHFTLYYYDRAGRLTQTVPPEGVEPLSETEVDDLLAFRAGIGSWQSAFDPAHRMRTRYAYNSFGLTQSASSPDAQDGVGPEESSQFLYDDLNRLRFSQDPQQQADAVFSYIKYDELGRVVETGESDLIGTWNDLENELDPVLVGATAVVDVDATYPPATANNTYVTSTTYSTPSGATYYGEPQRYLQNRISHAVIDPDPAIAGDEYHTHYSYDAHGNVTWLVQQDPTLGDNYIAYEYDLVSANVLKVRYNELRDDAFFHKYTYDAENRIATVQTSRDGELWDTDGQYDFYDHGALSRTDIGEDHVQGLDLAYTVHGWIKAINSPRQLAIDGMRADPGQDGTSTATLTETARDAWGMSLGYYAGDYSASNNFLDNTNALVAVGNDLYNGNIATWAQQQWQYNSGTSEFERIAARGSYYTYDILNRIKTSDQTTEPATPEDNPWTAAGFSTNYAFDANGNLKTLQRHDAAGLLIDDFSYDYGNGLGNDAFAWNRLEQVQDAAANPGTSDARTDLIGTHDYVYDHIGNLTQETGPEWLDLDGDLTFEAYDMTTDISWTPHGKVESVSKTLKLGATTVQTELISFAYDAAGNRIRKTVAIDPDGDGAFVDSDIRTTYYVRDGQGMPMAVYQRTNDNEGGPWVATIELQEHTIYGSDRLGLNDKKVELASIEYAGAGASLPAFTIPDEGPGAKSEFNNWITGSNLDKTLSDLDFTQGRLTDIDFDPTSGNFSAPGDLARFLGQVKNGVAVAEDLDGNIQFYAVHARNYMGNQDQLLIYDKTGQLMMGSEQLGATHAGTKPVIVQLQGTNKFALVTLNATRKPSYHIVDMDQLGYGTSNPAGSVIVANQDIDPTAPADMDYGYHFTGYEDHVNGKTVVYHTRYQPDALFPNSGTGEIVAYEFTGAYTDAPDVHSLYSVPNCGDNELGELQLSPDGAKLGWYRHDKHISAMAHREILLQELVLADDLVSVTGAPAQWNGSPAGNAGDGQFDYHANATDLLHSQRGVFEESGTEKHVWHLEPGTGNNALSDIAPEGYTHAEIKRGMDGNYHLPNVTHTGDELHNYSGAALGTPQTLPGADANQYLLASTLPTQVFKLGGQRGTTGSYLRCVGNKKYELKDHLGNVRVVVSDRKNLELGTTTYVSDTESADFAGYVPVGGSNLSTPGGQLKIKMSGGDFAGRKQYAPTGFTPGDSYSVSADIALGAGVSSVTMRVLNSAAILVDEATVTVDGTVVLASSIPTTSFYIEFEGVGSNNKSFTVDNVSVTGTGNYEPTILAYYDYYPFGMEMRGYVADEAYRYGFNGKEKDDELKGAGMHYDFGFRMHDARVGRFLSVDPLSGRTPRYSPYQFAGNKPIWKIDVAGLSEGDAEETLEDLYEQLTSLEDEINQKLDELGKEAYEKFGDLEATTDEAIEWLEEKNQELQQYFATKIQEIYKLVDFSKHSLTEGKVGLNFGLEAGAIEVGFTGEIGVGESSLPLWEYAFGNYNAAIRGKWNYGLELFETIRVARMLYDKVDWEWDDILDMDNAKAVWKDIKGWDYGGGFFLYAGAKWSSDKYTVLTKTEVENNLTLSFTRGFFKGEVVINDQLEIEGNLGLHLGFVFSGKGGGGFDLVLGKEGGGGVLLNSK